MIDLQFGGHMTIRHNTMIDATINTHGIGDDPH